MLPNEMADSVANCVWLVPWRAVALGEDPADVPMLGKLLGTLL